jgi:orotidine-5'-phosphate decarboxylase
MGLDPRMEQEGQIPKYLVDDLIEPNKVILEFNKSLIEETCDLIPIIKPQIAFYEKYDALTALKETIKYAHKNDLLVILDAKRNDIGSTSKAYADAMFKVYNADACTLNAYLGSDCIRPFLEYNEKGLFVLVKTSNPSSDDFQNLFSVRLEDVPDTEYEIEMDSIKLERNYIHMAKLVYSWGNDLQKFSEFHNLGVVVGATYPKELKVIKEIVKNSFVLIPGYGAQGAGAGDVKYGFNVQGLGGIVNSSRGIMFAYQNKKYPEEQFGKAAREEILEMNALINKDRI